MYGAPSTISRLWYCQSAAVCGNLIGGALLMGMVAHLANHWESPFFPTKEPGTGLAHDVESTRHHGEKEEILIPPPESNYSVCDGCPSVPACDPTFPRTTVTDETVHPKQQVDNVRIAQHPSIFRSARPGDDIV
jgi:hypothetical protein